MSATFAYDEVEYPTHALPQAHPGHLFAVASMFGVDPVPPDRCRYFEAGCGDGTHLVACALALPAATFVGVDLSAAAVDRGNRLIADLAVPNVRLYAADLTVWEPPAEGFDYAVAHGLYSWVPPPVRDSVLATFARVLGPNGVGYVSYNTYPGCYLRRMVWEILRHHTEAVAEPAAKIREAVEMVKFLIAGQTADVPPARTAYRHELDHLLNNRDPSVLYHDELAAVNDPVYFHEFVAHAGRFGLRFVAEAETHSMEPQALPAAAAALNELAARDVLLKEQYLDYLRLRRFRGTLLARDGRPPQHRPDPARVTRLTVSGNVRAEGTVDLAPGVEVKFCTGNEAAARTGSPLGKAALLTVGEEWPGRIPFPELLDLAAKRLGKAADPGEADVLARNLTASWMAGLVNFHGDHPHYARTVSDRPIASPLARAQMVAGPVATTMLHGTMRLEDAQSRLLVQLLDGTRDRDQLATELLPAFPQEDRPDPATLKDGLDRNLERMAKAGLLVG